MKEKSIKNTIFLTVSLSLLGLSLLLFTAQTYFESKRASKSTQELITEQIELVLAKLDIYRVENQKVYVAKTLFNLKHISSVKLFDKSCNVLNQRPLNFNINWDCNSELSDDFVVYTSSSSLSDSLGAIKFVVVKLNTSKLTWFSKYAIYMMAITFLFILLTLFLLNYNFKKRIMKPLDKLKKLVGTKGIMNHQIDSSLPMELKPIFNDVVKRDEVIRQKNIEINNMSNEVLKTEMRKEFAHNIKFPLMIIRDFILEKKSFEENEEVILRCLKDFELFSKKIGGESLQTVKQLNLVELVNNLVESKKTQFKSSSSKVEIKVKSDIDNIKIKFEPLELRAILSNLINNSKEATEIGENCSIKILIKQQNNRAIIEVHDTGQGISSNYLSQVFEKGATFNKPAGSGLGLYHAKKMIKKFDGDIEIRSIKSKGTCVVISLPIVKSKYLSHGKAPFKNVMVEDYELSQMVWYEQATLKNKSFIAFSSPSEFEKNSELIDKNANIYVDSNFPDSKLKGEVWSEKIFKQGFKNLFICSTNDININNFSWFKGTADKSKPFENTC